MKYQLYKLVPHPGNDTEHILEYCTSSEEIASINEIAIDLARQNQPAFIFTEPNLDDAWKTPEQLLASSQILLIEMANNKCQLCKARDINWYGQMLDSARDPLSWYRPGYHMRGFAILAVCDTCWQDHHEEPAGDLFAQQIIRR